ncbi:MAG: hypothetical protein KJ710_02350 [Candidatus Omnitrophica bacterium]|nr:hypothetical protein [Candidatus Omnitrophota bacterium]MBU1923088.1 hypothetical protein [Candidatus Omnitrophota bacterium]
MAKKELTDKKLTKDSLLSKEPSGISGDFSSKISGLSSKAFGIIKFILGIVLLPLVFSSASSFLNEFGRVSGNLQAIFWSGVICFLVIYLFIWEPVVIYSKGHKLLEIIFSFFKPMVNVAPFLMPIYAILVFIIYGLLSLPVKSSWLIKYAIFLIGFSAILHLVFSAKTIRTKKGDFLKGNYIFGFSFIFILNLALLALGFSLIFKEFSFVNFCNISFTIASNIFYAIFKQLFLF